MFSSRNYIIIPYIDKKGFIFVFFCLRGINMNEVKKSITFMQNNLNKLLHTAGPTGCKTPGIYSLSIKLDKEIVKYYKSLSHH